MIWAKLWRQLCFLRFLTFYSRKAEIQSKTANTYQFAFLLSEMFSAKDSNM